MTLRITPINSVGKKTRNNHGIDFDSDATRVKTKIYFDGDKNSRVISNDFDLSGIQAINNTLDLDKRNTITVTPAISKVSEEKVWLNTANEAYSKIPEPDYKNTEPYALRFTLAVQHASGWVWQKTNTNTFDDGDQQIFGRAVIAQLDCMYRYASVDISAGPVVFTFNNNDLKNDEHFSTCQWFDMFGRHEGLTHFGDGEVKVVVCRKDDDVSGVDADHVQRISTDYCMALVRVQFQCARGYTIPTSEQINTRTPPENNFWDVDPTDYNLDLIKTNGRGEHVRYSIEPMEIEDFVAYTDKLLEFLNPHLNFDDTLLATNFSADESALQAFRGRQVQCARYEIEPLHRLPSGWYHRIYEHYDDSDWVQVAVRQRTAIWPVPMYLDDCGVEYAHMVLPKGKQFYFEMPHFNVKYFWSFVLYNNLSYLNGYHHWLSSQFGLTPGPNGRYRIYVTHERPASLNNDAGEYWLPLHATDSYRIVYRCYGSDGNRAQSLSKITLL